jgi:hypothetical protein
MMLYYICYATSASVWVLTLYCDRDGGQIHNDDTIRFLQMIS